MWHIAACAECQLQLVWCWFWLVTFSLRRMHSRDFRYNFLYRIPPIVERIYSSLREHKFYQPHSTCGPCVLVDFASPCAALSYVYVLFTSFFFIIVIVYSPFLACENYGELTYLHDICYYSSLFGLRSIYHERSVHTSIFCVHLL